MEKIRTAVCTAIALAVVSLFSAAAHAELNEYILDSGLYSEKEIAFMEDLERLIEEHSNTPICVSDYGINVERLNELYTTLYCSRPDFYYASGVKGLITYSNDELYFNVKYNYDKDRTELMQKEIDRRTDEIFAGMGENMTVKEKLLYFHDAVVGMVEYTESETDRGRNIYDVFVKGKALCVGYSLAFEYLCDKAGIPCITVYSKDHIWNMVQVDDEWYYVDCTWDELVTEQPNCVMHMLLLVSEDYFNKYYMSHGDYEAAYEADSDRFEDELWRSVICRMDYYKGIWYFVADGGFYCYDVNTGAIDLPYEFHEVWLDPKNTEMTVSFGKTNIWDGYILFSSKYNIYRYDPMTGKTKKIYSANQSRGMICDFVVKNNRVYVYQSDDVDSSKGVTSTFLLKKPKDGTYDVGLYALGTEKYIKICWDDLPKAEQYVIYRHNNSNGRNTKIGTTVGTSFTFKRTESDEDCRYSVRVLTADGLSDFCTWITAE